MKAEIISVGTELLLGNIVNTNTAFIAGRLAELGIDVYRTSVVGDNRERLEQELTAALSRADIAILTGGLGPTYDDVTKAVVCDHFGRGMVPYQPALDKINGFIDRISAPKETVRMMAYIPEGSQVLPNDNGSAAGFAITENGKTVAVLPGPPRECERMAEKYLKPYLAGLSDKVLVSRFVNLIGIAESEVENTLGDDMRKVTNPTIAPYIKPGEVMVRVTAQAASEEEAKALVDPAVDMLCEKFGHCLYATDAKNIESVALSLLKEKGLTVAFAESCTGGNISKRLTDLPGASQVIGCGFVTYSNDAKVKLLGVSPETLKAHGAVSEETAAEMAAGARRVSGADIAVSITGIAGPDGGTEEKPVGTVCIGVDSNMMSNAYKFIYRGDRATVREIAATHAFYRLIEAAKMY